MTTKIDWTDHSIGGAKLGLYGCSHAKSRGCDHCWSPPMFTRFREAWNVPDGITKGDRWTGKVVVDYSRVGPAFESLPKRAGLRVFVPSSVDLFHPIVPGSFIELVFRQMAERPQVFQVLTKRPHIAAEWAEWWTRERGSWPPNIWIGCSCSTQADVDRMVPDLLRVPAAVRFLSLEPLLEPVEFECYQKGEGYLKVDECGRRTRNWDQVIHHVIVGCESGPRRRPCPDEWVRSVVDQCRDQLTACFVKQLDRPDGVIHATDPRWLSWAVQQFPEVP